MNMCNRPQHGSIKHTATGLSQSQVGFVVDKEALRQVPLWVLHFSSIHVIPEMLHTYSFICH